MGTPDPRIERWLSKDRPWREELAALRDILLSEDLTEALKWRQPCYVAHGGNVAILGSVAESATVSFLKGVLLDDPDMRLAPPGPNSRSARYMRFDGLETIRADAELLRGFLVQAIEIEKSGRKVDLPKDDISLPDELAEAMDADPELAEAFAALTPGRQRGWALHVAGAKMVRTRRDRIQKARPAIFAGKGIHDR